MSICSQELLTEALDSVRSSVERYLLVNCRRIVSMARIAMQRNVKIEFHGFFRYYIPSPNFPRFMDAFTYIAQCIGGDIKIYVNNFEITFKDNYAVVLAKVLNDLCMYLNEKQELMKNEFE
ncbi:MAG: hypothetical protein LM582_04820 [Desulfurococcaceae archaeon]|nr:hypothetical protein [Desulfurococcaceae archaeon]